MITKTLYRVVRSDGGIDVTPNKPSHNDYTETFRLIADEGMVLTDGTNICECIDTDEPSKYTEVKGEDFTEEQLEALKGTDGKTPIKGTDEVIEVTSN